MVLNILTINVFQPESPLSSLGKEEVGSVSSLGPFTSIILSLGLITSNTE